MPPHAAASHSGANLVLVGRRSDLFQFQGQADLPPRVFTLFEGCLEQTAGDQDSGDLDRLWSSHQVVGLDADLLHSHPEDGPREQRYRDNLGQKLAARRVALLVVLRDCDFGARSIAVTLQRRDGARPRVSCRPTSQTIADWLGSMAMDGLRHEWESDPAQGLARLRIVDAESDGLMGAQDEAAGNLAELLELRSAPLGERRDLVSRWFAQEFSTRADAKVQELLLDCARRQEQESLQRLLDSWTSATQRMQQDTQALTQLELVLVATRPFDSQDLDRLAGFERLARTWVMSDRLRAGGDRRTLVRARHVWPDAVGALLARLVLDVDPREARGTYAWRSFVCGIGSDPAEIERIRAQWTQEILDRADEAPRGTDIERRGPFAPIPEGWDVDRSAPQGVSWDQGNGESLVAAELAESKWVADHRTAGDRLAKQRMDIGRALEGSDGRDPERVFSQQYWQRVHRSPGDLRVYGTARLFRAGFTIQDKIAKHRKEWKQDVLERRRRLAAEREELLHHAEELDRAHKFHVPIELRMLIGSAVAVYAGFLSLNVLRVLLTLETGTWATGVWIFAAALAGGWFGAFAPAWVERTRGLRATARLNRQLEAVDESHRTAVAATHEVFRDAEDVRQTIRITAVQRRTTLLAERAWSIVVESREHVAREFQRRKLLGAQASSAEAAHERLAVEDLRDWRSVSVVRPVETMGDKINEARWKAAFDGLLTQFKQEWQAAMSKEDPFFTGFLRVAVLRRLVQQLAGMVSASIEWQLLEDAQEESDRDGTRSSPEFWVAKITAAVGTDAASHSMLSLLDDGAAQRSEGTYRVFRRREMLLAEAVCKQLARTRQGFAETVPIDVDALPLGGFAMVFHEVPVLRKGSTFVLDDSDRADPSVAGGLA